MTADELRSAALLFAPELAAGTVTPTDLDRPEVRKAVRAGRRPPARLSRVRQIALERGIGPFADDSVETMAAARRAVLGAAAAGPPKILLRVDEFPSFDALDDSRHDTAAFRRFHEVLHRAGVPYLLAVRPALAQRPLDPTATAGRPLSEEERAVLAEVAGQGVTFAQNGYDHRSRFVEPARRSELEGRSSADLAAVLDRGLEDLAALGIRPRVFVPPFNGFSADQWLALAQRFDVVCGGPETVVRLGFRRTPLWRGDAVFAPSYPPLNGRAEDLLGVIDRLEEQRPGTWALVTLHAGLEADDGFGALTELAARLGGLARPWDEFLADVDLSATTTDDGHDRRPLHIASVQTSYEKGGGEFANVNLLAALAERGDRVKLLTNQPDIVAGTSVPTTDLQLGPKLGTRTVGRTALRFLPGLIRLVRALRVERRDEGPIDIAMLHFKKEQFMSALFPPRLAGAIVWAEWGPLPPQLRSGIGRAVYLLAARRAKVIIGVSESTRESLEAAGVAPGKLAVIPTLLDPSILAFDAEARARRRAEWGVEEHAFVIGCVSRFNKSKKLRTVIDALEHLPPDTTLVLAGTGPDEDALRERARPYGARVRFLPVPRGYVQEVVSALDVLVFAPQPSEGLPRAIMFGQLAERPVVATDDRPIPGLIPAGTGAAVEPRDDPVALAAVLDGYRQDPARRAREGAAGRRFALEHYDPIRATDELERLLHHAARRRR